MEGLQMQFAAHAVVVLLFSGCVIGKQQTSSTRWDAKNCGVLLPTVILSQTVERGRGKKSLKNA